VVEREETECVYNGAEEEEGRDKSTHGCGIERAKERVREWERENERETEGDDSHRGGVVGQLCGVDALVPVIHIYIYI
jgi:hypothetical protein